MHKLQKPFCCCLDDQDESFIKAPLQSIKLIQIAFIILDLIVTESGFLYLASIQVNWRRGGFFSVDVQRVVLGLSLLTTVVLLILSRSRWRRWHLDTQVARCAGCGGLPSKDVDEFRTSAKCDWDFGDYVHSLLNASSFIVCSVCMVGYLPDDYDHPVEVAIKVVSVLLDLILCLLFTKSCMLAYFQYQVPEKCKCLRGNISLPPPIVNDVFDEEDLLFSKVNDVTRTSNGHVYTMVRNEEDHR